MYVWQAKILFLRHVVGFIIQLVSLVGKNGLVSPLIGNKTNSSSEFRNVMYEHILS